MYPIVSVVMSVYNGEKYLRESVESILNQTFSDFEFIIINDGSTDVSREILESYHDERIVLVHQENVGLTRALNKGLALAKGKYIARQDADDISRPERLEKQVAFMEAIPSVGLLGTRFEFIDENGTIVRTSPLPTENSILQDQLISINLFCHASVVIRREALEKAGGYRDFFRYSQDYDLWLRIAEQYEIANLTYMLVQYRELPDAISAEKILLQSRYACAAAEMARQRRETGTDALEQGNIPPLPPIESFSDLLQKKLTNYYARHPLELITGLSQDTQQEEMHFLFEKICSEHVNYTATCNKQEGYIKWADTEIKRKDERIKEKYDQIAQVIKEKDGRIGQITNQKNELIVKKNLQIKQSNQQLIQNDEQLRQKRAELAAIETRLQIALQENEGKTREVMQYAAEINELENVKEQLISENNSITADKDRLTFEMNQLAAERDQLTIERDQLAVEKNRLGTEKDQLSAEKYRLEEVVRQREEQIEGILASKSWQITAPLRSALDLFKKES